MTKKLWLVSSLTVLVLLLAACGGRQAATSENKSSNTGSAEGQSPAREQEPPQLPAAAGLDTQTSDAGRVVVDVTPRSLSGDAWTFDVALNTHSVNLDYDLTQISALRCDQGQEFAPVAWEGAGPGGHHRSGVLQFAALDHPTSFVELVVRDVAGTPERVFHWEMPATELDEVPASPPAPASQDEGAAHLSLSTQEFYFGDVVMSQGVVSRTIEVANLGPGVLHIDGVEPT